ncbi:prepilin-type N-terminal cleavage/methylation domain-containing protein, partial [Candidatus Gracilibacteria bacterium]|nr:prepilin-type N-terminal cleavage/methylation domain-containing protein [Candidatus Gracilibacteria bacterium]
MKQNQKISNIITKKAFTIIELIVVITILAILGTIGFVSFSSHLVGVRDTSRQEQLGSIYQGLESYKTKNILPLPDD